MNAIPQNAHNYNRIQIPKTPAIERTRPMAKVESLDAHRAAKLALLKRQREVSGQREQRQPEPRQSPPQRQVVEQQYKKASVPRAVGVDKRQNARKLTAAYEVNVRSTQYRQSYDIGTGGAAVRRNAGVLGFDMHADNYTDEAYGRQVAVEYRAPRKKGVISTIIAIAIVFTILAGILVKYAELSNVTYQNTQMESAIASMEKQLDQIKIDIAMKENMGSIQQRAQELGMSHPTDTQVQYVDMSTEVPVAVDTEHTVIDMSSGQPIGKNGTTGVENAQAGGAIEGIQDFFGVIVNTIKGWFN